MIISKRKFNEKVREALEQQDKERWMHEKIDRVERECNERIDGLFRHMCDMEQKIAILLDEKGQAERKRNE